MHERANKARLEAAAAQVKQKNNLGAGENTQKAPHAPAKQPPENAIRKAEISYAENFLSTPDPTTLGLMREKKLLNDQIVKEAKQNKVDTPTPGTDMLMWMACSGTERERKPFIVMVLPTLLESNQTLKELLGDNHNSVVIDKVEFKTKNNKLLAPRVNLHIRNDRTLLETHYQCKFQTHVAMRENPNIPVKKIDPTQAKKPTQSNK